MIKRDTKRQLFILFLIFSFFIVFVARLFYIQLISGDYFRNKAANQQTTIIKIPPERGAIYDTNMRYLAIDVDAYSLYAVPRYIKNKKAYSKILSSALNLNIKTVSDRLSRDKQFVWIKRKLTKKELSNLEGINDTNLGFIREPERNYPNGKIGCQVIGFANIDNKGLEGLELQYNDKLRGKVGFLSPIRDARQVYVRTVDNFVAPKNGFDLVLTIDQVIQHIAEEGVDQVVKKYKPDSVSIVAIQPQTGRILAMANYPNFDPNHPGNFSQDTYRNRCITDSFEPGSVFKAITASSVIDSGAVKEDDVFDCENGEYRFGKRILHDYKPYGNLTFAKVIEKSSNIGTSKAAQKLGKDLFYAYIKKFGFGNKTQIDLPGEVKGILRPVAGWSYVDMSTIPMGQGISCTTIQLASAFSAIANGGLLMKPYVVEKIIDENKNLVKQNNPDIIRRVIKNDSSRRVREILAQVVNNGTGRRAKMANYQVCGKTGTAQKVDSSGGYSKNKYVATFAGFAPKDNPAIVLVVLVDNPKGSHFGGVVSAPAFKNIMEKSLRYLEIPHEK